MNDRNNEKEIFEYNSIATDDNAEQLERYIEQMKEEIKQLKKLSKQREKVEKLEREKKKIISNNLKSNRRHR